MKSYHNILNRASVFYSFWDGDRWDSPPVTSNEKQKDFARRYIQLCMKSRSYGSTLLNLIPLSEESTAMKLAQEIDAVTRVYPSYFGLEEACAPLRKAIFEVFVEEIEGGEEVLAHLT